VEALSCTSFCIPHTGTPSRHNQNPTLQRPECHDAAAASPCSFFLPPKSRVSEIGPPWLGDGLGAGASPCRARSTWARESAGSRRRQVSSQR